MRISLPDTLRRCLPLAGLALFLATAAQAQGSNSDAPAAAAVPAATAVPLDGGVSLLLAGGVGYGLKRLRQRRAARKS